MITLYYYNVIMITHHANDRIEARLGNWYDETTARNTYRAASQYRHGKYYAIVRKFDKVEINPVSNRFGKYIIAVILNGKVMTFLVEKEINPNLYNKDGILVQ